METTSKPDRTFIERGLDLAKKPLMLGVGTLMTINGFANEANAQESGTPKEKPAHVLRLNGEELSKPKIKLHEDPEVLRILEEYGFGLESPSVNKKTGATLVSKTKTDEKSAYENRLDSIIAKATKAGVLKGPEDFTSPKFNFNTRKTEIVPNQKAYTGYVDDLKARARKAFPDDVDLVSKLLSAAYQLGVGDRINNAPPIIDANEIRPTMDLLLKNNQDLSRLLDDLLIVRTKQVNGMFDAAKSDLLDLTSGKDIYKITKR
jgi:hypothetical protein